MIQVQHTVRSSITTGVIAWALAAAASAAPLGDKFSPEKASQEFIKSHGLEGVPRDKVRLEEVLQKHFVHGRFGVFDIYFPVTGFEKRAEYFQNGVSGALDGQLVWLDWLKPVVKEQKDARDDQAAIRNWVEKWNPGTLQSKARNAAGADVFELLSAPDSVIAAAKRFADSLGRGDVMGVERKDVFVTPLILMPDRKTFCEFVSFLGWSDPELQKYYFVPNVAEWTQCFYNEYQIIALEYAMDGRAQADYTAGRSMNDNETNVMQQQVMQLGMNAYFDQLFEQKVPKAFVGGLSMNVVIDKYDTISTKNDGDLRGRSTAAREIFIAGALSDGFLPPISAETRWRETHGRDHFIGVLRAVQKEGEELAKKEPPKKGRNNNAYFAIRADNGGDKMSLVAPFLGSVAAETKPPPEVFKGEFLEFVRSYKCGFIHWLRNVAGGDEKKSREKFAQLLQGLADPKRAGDFEKVFVEIYGGDLSNATADKNCIEGKFLLWLAKQKGARGS